MNTKAPFFSIITPIYNCERYLEECIESVVNQTYQSWELILVNDGSTDKSGEICERYSDDSRIKVIHQENKGELHSRLRGIGAATGQFELGLDADDYLDNKCLEVLKKAIDSSGADLIFYGLRWVDGKQGECRCSLHAQKVYSQEEVLEEVITKTNHSLCNKVIRLAAVKKADYTELNGKVRFNLDYAQIIPIISNVNKAYVIDDVLYNYRIHKESISQLSKVEHILDTGDVTEFVISKLEAHLTMDDKLQKRVYLAYLNMISGRLINLFLVKKITKEGCEKIHSSGVYVNSRKFEAIKEFNLFVYIMLKLFRYKQYWLLHIISAMRRYKAHLSKRVEGT